MFQSGRGHESNGTNVCPGWKYLQNLRGNPDGDYIRRISRSFLKKGVDEKLISPVEKNMTWQISSSEMFPHETERLSFRTVKEVKILVNDSSINIIFREISLEPLRSLNPLPLFDVCSRIFRNMTLHYSETEREKPLVRSHELCFYTNAINCISFKTTIGTKKKKLFLLVSSLKLPFQLDSS